VRERFDLAFAAWGRLTYRHPLVTVIACLVILAPLVAQIRTIQIDTTPEGFLHDEDPIVIAYDDFRTHFGRDDLVVLAIRAPDLFEPSFLKRLAALHAELEDEIPNIQEVQSLINARETRGLEDELIVGELFDPWPETAEGLAERKRRVLANPLYTDLLISSDGRIAALTIEIDTYAGPLEDDDLLSGFDEDTLSDPAATSDEAPAFITSAQTNEVLAAIEKIVDRHRGDGFEIYASGAPVMAYDLGNMLQRDMRTFTGLAIATIAILLAVLFRRAAGVVLPLVVVVLSVVGTIGVLATLGFVVSLPTQVLPSFMLAVAVGDSVHVLTIFFLRFDKGESREDAIANALGHSGLPILMTSLTTAGGLISFVAAEIAPISNLGVVAPSGVMIAFALSVTLLPALVAIFPMRQRSLEAPDRTSHLRKFLIACGEFGIDHAKPVVAVAALVIAISAVGASFTQFGHDVIRWFPEHHAFRTATALINDEMGGAIALEVLIDTRTENGLKDPATLDRIARAASEAIAYRDGKVEILKAVSLVDVVKEIHQALNENRPEFHVVPADRMLVAQELLLFENTGSDDLLDFADSRLQIGRMTLKAPLIDAAAYAPYLEKMGSRFSEIFGESIDYSFTGLLPVMSQTVTAVIQSMASSYVIALAVITPLMILLIGNLRIGLLAMIPNITPILIAIGAMGWLGIPIDAFTMMVGAISIGLVVDDTIHVLHGFRGHFDKHHDVRAAVKETLSTTGLAILFTTVVLSSGFAIYTISTMNNLIRFGSITATVIALAFVADIILAPALLSLTLGRKQADSRGQANPE
jgi:predicted RND superfamily exporter protein